VVVAVAHKLAVEAGDNHMVVVADNIVGVEPVGNIRVVVGLVDNTLEGVVDFALYEIV
jgi:hypothetical protein